MLFSRLYPSFHDSYKSCRCGDQWEKYKKDQNQYVVIGEDNSWYRHYHVDGKCWTRELTPQTWNEYIWHSVERSGNFGTTYPGLEKEIKDGKRFGCPDSLALGTNGYYFARWAGRRAWCLPNDITNHIGGNAGMKQVKRLFLGKCGSYVVIMEDGSAKWDLKGGYNGLDDYIRKQGSADRPKVRLIHLFITLTLNC